VQLHTCNMTCVLQQDYTSNNKFASTINNIKIAMSLVTPILRRQFVFVCNVLMFIWRPQPVHFTLPIKIGNVSPLHVTKAYRGVEVYCRPFLTPVLGGGEWSASRPHNLSPGERVPSTNCTGGWEGTAAGSNIF
jgi:hypothetical protein